MYFTTLSEVNQIKTEYHRLALLHHPDKGGDTATMQQINAEYQEALARCDGQTSKGFDGKDHTYTYNVEVEQAVVDKINEILSYNLLDTELELVGTWIWVGGETFQHKDVLGKALKMNFSRRHQKWSWHNGPKYRRRSKLSYDEIRAAYGSKKYEEETSELLRSKEFGASYFGEVARGVDTWLSRDPEVGFYDGPTSTTYPTGLTASP